MVERSKEGASKIVPHHRGADDDKRDAGLERPRRHRRSHRPGMMC